MNATPATSPPVAALVRPPFALRESHAHLLAYGQSLVTPSLAMCQSLAECLRLIREEAAKSKLAAPGQGGWVRFASAHNNIWPEARWPTPAELEAAAQGVPCVVMSFDHHTAVCNLAALDAAGLKPGQSVPTNGLVEVDEAGKFTGVLHEQAAYKVWGSGPEPTHEQMRQGLGRALASLAAMGFAEVHDMLAPPLLPQLLRELAAAGTVLPRIRMYCAPDHAEEFLRTRVHWPAGVSFGGMKLFADGTLSSRTALMVHRYSEPLPDASRGRCMTAPGAIGQTLARCHELGVDLAVHAIGDGAVKMVLDCVERLDGQLAGTPRRCRVRIEHAELVDKLDVPRFVRLKVDCSVQPCHLLCDVESLKRYVPHRLDRVLPLRELLDAGLIAGRLGMDSADETDTEAICNAPAGLVFGSDVPIVRAEPEDSVYAAVYRRRAGMNEAEAIAPGQAISMAEAWSCFAEPAR